MVGEDGWPVEMRGVVDQVPGLFFCGLAFQYAFSSMVFPGIGRDAEYLSRRIGDREGAGGTQPRTGLCSPRGEVRGRRRELLRAREAFDRRDWVAAYEGLSAAGSDALLAADFADLATAAFLVGRHNDCIQALQRAYQAHLDAGDQQAAVRSPSGWR